MSWHTNKLKMALGLGGVVSLYGLFTMAALFIPYPRIGMGERAFIIIAFVVITLPFILLFSFIMSRRKKKKEALKGEAGGSAAAPDAPSANGQPAVSSPAGSYGNLLAGAEEAVQFLKSSNLGS